MTDLFHLARAGATICVRVTPNARQSGIEIRDGQILIRVKEPPEAGRATEAARVALARVMGVPRSRLTLVRGATAREKFFRLD
jgi:uncharacterized protein YggU (UPF0235/DUF167 family)